MTFRITVYSSFQESTEGVGSENVSLTYLAVVTCRISGREIDLSC